MLSNLPINWTKVVDKPDPTLPYNDPRNGTKQHPTFPQCLANAEYIKHMGYVDLSNRLCSDLTVNRKAYKWVTKSLYGFIDITITNAMILYNLTTATQTYRDSSGKIRRMKRISKNDAMLHIAMIGVSPMSKLYLDNWKKWASRVRQRMVSATEEEIAKKK
eukprot:967144_1